MRKKIKNQLLRLGITPNYAGYLYSTQAVLNVLDDEELLLNITKGLYWDVAKCYNTTPFAVERNIRTVVQVAWKHNPEELSRLARCKLMKRPTAAQFIAIIASYFE